MHLPHPLMTLIQRTIHGGGDGQGAANHSTDADEEAGEGLGAGFAVDDFHGGDVLEFTTTHGQSVCLSPCISGGVIQKKNVLKKKEIKGNSHKRRKRPESLPEHVTAPYALPARHRHPASCAYAT